MVHQAWQMKLFFFPSPNRTFYDTLFLAKEKCRKNARLGDSLIPSGKSKTEKTHRVITRLAEGTLLIAALAGMLKESSPAGLSTLTAKGIGRFGVQDYSATFSGQGPIWKKWNSKCLRRVIWLTYLAVCRLRRTWRKDLFVYAPSLCEGARGEVD